MHTRVCVVSFPFRPGVDSPVPLDNLIQILEPLVKNVIIITSNIPLKDLPSNVICRNIAWEYKATSLPSRLIRNFLTQVKYSNMLIKSTRTHDIIIFLGASTFVIPIFVARLLSRPPILIATTSETGMIRYSSTRTNMNLYSIPSYVVAFIENLNWSLANTIIVYSPNFIKEWNLERHARKIKISHRHFVNTSLFAITKPIDRRTNSIGFVGRFSKEKGIENFIEAASILLKAGENIDFFIYGSGEMRDGIETYISQNGFDEKVHVIGWVPHKELSKYLNDLKLIVIPSYTEGLPNIMVEAMACGTPVLATDVGSIRDFIIDGKTGFILPNNNPESISDNILRAINYPALKVISLNSRSLVEAEFTYSAAIKRWSSILEGINN